MKMHYLLPKKDGKTFSGFASFTSLDLSLSWPSDHWSCWHGLESVWPYVGLCGLGSRWFHDLVCSWPCVFSAWSDLGLVGIWVSCTPGSGRLTGSQLDFFLLVDTSSQFQLVFSSSCWPTPILNSKPQASHEVHRLRQATHPNLRANHGHILASYLFKVQPPCLHFKVFVNLHLARELFEEGWQLWCQGSCLSQPRVRRAPFSLLRQSWRDLCGSRCPLLGTWSCRPWN